MDVVERWTAHLAVVLQQALRETNDDFAAALGVAPRTVAKWHQNPATALRENTQRMLDTALRRADETVQQRFALVVGSDRTVQANATDTPGESPASPADTAAERRLSGDRHIGSALDWLDNAAGWTPGEARRQVAQRLAGIDPRDIQDRSQRRSRVAQRNVAEALESYYADAGNGFRPYRADCAGRAMRTSILTRPDWLDLRLRLGDGSEEMKFSGTPELPVAVDTVGADAAVQRLAETVAVKTTVVDAPLYRLLDVDVDAAGITGTVALTHFVGYAVTLDLLENELTDALAAGNPTTPGALPLRDSYLPTPASVLNVADRLCVGGALALCAIARPGNRSRRGTGDYLLFVQERSGRVLNAARRLAVIPKSFHGPLVDYAEDAQFCMTLEREMEEELFGRDDVDSVLDDLRHADPMHPSRLSMPMRWLVDHPNSWRMECTGFGYNLVSGNFECAGLIVIDDEAWWEQFGGHIAANWESEGLRRYSSLDRDTVAGLVHDPAWSNEGLFALLQGIRRLSEIGGSRVDLPSVEREL